MNSLIADSLKGTVQNASSALSAFGNLLGQTKEGSDLYFLLLPIIDALEHEANK